MLIEKQRLFRQRRLDFPFLGDNKEVNKIDTDDYSSIAANRE